MKVAVVCPYALDAHGGVQDQAERLVAWLRARGHEAWAVAPGSGGPPGTISVGGWRSVRANRSRAPISLERKTFRRTAEAIAGADVVHVHEPLMPLVSIGAVLRSRAPLVGTFHADPGRAVRRAYRLGGGLLRRVASRLSIVTAVSPVAASALPQVPEVRIIPNAVEVDRPAGVDRVPGRVLFIGRDEERKGLDLALEAWPRVMRDVPGAELRVVGAHRDGGPEGVTFLGRVEEEQKRAELWSSQVLVAPNLGGESFGIVVVEGMTAGCAVVASDIPAFRAVAGDAATLVPAGEPLPLAAEVVRLLSDEPARDATVAASRERAGDFAPDVVMSAYLSAYEDAIEIGAGEG